MKNLTILTVAVLFFVQHAAIFADCDCKKKKKNRLQELPAQEILVSCRN